MTNVTTEIQGAAGIAGGYPRLIDIEHNEVSNVNYTGITVGYGWTSAANAMSGNKINYNNIHNVAQLLADGGAVYTLSNQGTASQIKFNYLHDLQRSPWADYADHCIYRDEQTGGYTVSDNVFVNCPGLFRNGTQGMDTITNNTGTLASSISAAGIEPAYLGIKSHVTIPVPTFSATGPTSPGACP